jgi:hypothetical protein
MAPTVFAEPPPTVPGGTTTAANPDDLTQLGDLIYVSFQNNAGKDGTPAGSFSTIAAYHADTGALATTYQLTGRCDGLTADLTHHRLLASVNEDNNTPPSRRCVNCCSATPHPPAVARPPFRSSMTSPGSSVPAGFWWSTRKAMRSIPSTPPRRAPDSVRLPARAQGR